MHTQPVHLTTDYDLTTFDCGVTSLNIWLRHNALHNETTGASRSYVIHDRQEVIAYYALAAASIRRDWLPGRVRRNKPDPIPVLLLGRLAVDHRFHSLGLGHRLYQDAVYRTLEISEMTGVVAIITHAISDAARTFYLKLGFHELETKPYTMYLMLKEIRRSLSPA